MNANITGIGPMMACVKGAENLQGFTPDQLWNPIPDGWFDPKVDIGGRGYKYFDVATWYLMAATKHIDAVQTEGSLETLASHKGIVIGSNSSTRRELNDMYRTVYQEGAGAIPPMRAPLFCPNMGVGALAVRHQAKALNITLMNPMTAGLEALILAKNAIVNGRATHMIAGAMEDDCEFTLGQHYGERYTVNTAGGAWALRLEASENVGTEAEPARAAIGGIGATLNRFIPHALEGKRPNTEQLLKSLEQDFAPLLSGGQSRQITIAALNDPHSQFIYGLLKQIFVKHRIQERQAEAASKDTSHGTLLALADFSWLCLKGEPAVCVAIGPLGHLAAVEVVEPWAKG